MGHLTLVRRAAFLVPRGKLCSQWRGGDVGDRALWEVPICPLTTAKRNGCSKKEHPGPNDLESALMAVTLSDVVQHTPLVVESNSTLAAVIEAM